MQTNPIKVLLAKSTLESHDRGARYTASKLRDAGMEVVFMNFLEPSEVIQVALQEDVDVIGISSSSHGHVAVMETIMEGVRNNNLDDVLVILGGVIPNKDVPRLLELAVAGVFGPGSSARTIIEFIRNNARQKARA